MLVGKKLQAVNSIDTNSSSSVQVSPFQIDLILLILSVADEFYPWLLAHLTVSYPEAK